MHVCDPLHILCIFWSRVQRTPTSFFFLSSANRLFKGSYGTWRPYFPARANLEGFPGGFCKGAQSPWNCGAAMPHYARRSYSGGSWIAGFACL